MAVERELHVGGLLEKGRAEAPQQIASEKGHAQTNYSSGQREQDRLCKELCDDASSRGANGKTNRNLAFAPGGARHQQIGDVRTGDEQHQADHTHHEFTRAFSLSLDVRVEGGFKPWHDSKAAAFMWSGKIVFQLGSDVLQFGARLIDGDTRFEPSNREEIQESTVVVHLFQNTGENLVVRRHRHPHVWTAEHGSALKSSGHYADNSESLAIQQHVPSDNVRIGGEVALPNSMGENNDARRAGLIFVGTEGSTESSLHAEHIEEIARNQ